MKNLNASQKLKGYKYTICYTRHCGYYSDILINASKENYSPVIAGFKIIVICHTTRLQCNAIVRHNVCPITLQIIWGVFFTQIYLHPDLKAFNTTGVKDGPNISPWANSKRTRPQRHCLCLNFTPSYSQDHTVGDEKVAVVSSHPFNLK